MGLNDEEIEEMRDAMSEGRMRDERRDDGRMI